MQNRDIPMTDVVPETPTQVICRLAIEAIHQSKRKNFLAKVAELQAYLANHCVDVGLYRKPPTAILMEQGEENAAWLLVNQFGASPASIAYEYGRQCRWDQLTEVMNDFDDCTVTRMGVRGAVESVDMNDAEQVKKLILLAKRPPYIRLFRPMVVLGKRGNFELLDDTSGEFCNVIKKNSLVEIYILRKEVDRVNRLLDLDLSDLNLINRAAILYIKNGLIDEAKQLIEKKGASIDEAACASAKYGEVNLVDELLLKGASRNAAAYGYACGGYVDKVREMIAMGADKAMAFYGYLKRCHYQQIVEYMPDARDMDEDMMPKVGSDYKQLRRLSFIQDDEKRAKLAVGFLIHHEAIYTNNLMHRFKLDYKQARKVQSSDDGNRIKYYLATPYEMSFEQASALAQHAPRKESLIKTWLKAGQKLVAQDFLNNDIVALIASYVASLPFDDGETLRQKITPNKYLPTLFNPSNVPPVEPPGSKRKQSEAGSRKRRR